jgi:hypothetical protein
MKRGPVLFTRALAARKWARRPRALVLLVRVSSMATLGIGLVALAGCSPPHDRQPNEAEQEEALNFVRTQEAALNRAERDEAEENEIEALNELDQKVRNPAVK